MATGTVKWFMSEKRFGAIIPDEGAEDLYVHESAILDDAEILSMGTRVTFEVETAADRRMAVNVRALGQDDRRARRRHSAGWSSSR